MAADPERGFANFVRWSNIAQERRIQYSLIDHHDAIPELRLERMARLSEHKSWQYDVGISFCDEKAVFFQIAQLPLSLVHLILQDLLSLGRRCLGVEFRLELLQFVFSLRDELAHFTGFLRPAVAGKGLKVSRRTIHIGRAIGIGAICIHIHVALDQERFPICLGVL